jgi:hypothetical protein
MWRFDDRAETATASQHFRQLFLPFGVDALAAKPSVVQYGDRLYMCGGHSDNIVVDEHERVNRMGMVAPSSAPTITGATGTGYIGYLSFWDELTDEHSPLSAGTAISSTTPRTWSDLPPFEPNNFMYPHGYVNCDSTTTPDRVVPRAYSGAVAADTLSPLFYLRPGDKVYQAGFDTLAYLQYPDDVGTSGLFSAYLYAAGQFANPMGKPSQRASHVCLWLSVAGGLPRLVTKVRLGTASVEESVSVSLLGEAHPGTFERFPICTMNTVYHDRQVMAGDANALDTVYLSPIGFLERYEGFKFRTRNGEAITSLIGTRDYCLILTENSTYILQGYTEDDMAVSLMDNGIGASGHLTNVVVNGTPYVTNRTGIYMYNGSWHPVLLGGDKTFGRHFTQHPDNYRSGFLVDNPIDHTLQLFLGADRDGTPFMVPRYVPNQIGEDEATLGLFENYSWVAGYETVSPQAGGSYGAAMLGMDRNAICTATDTFVLSSSVAFLNAEKGNAYLYHGTTDGRIYREDQDTVFAGDALILTPTYLFDEAGGFEPEGKTLIKFWTHASTEQSGFTVCALGGDEWVGFQSFLASTHLYGVDNPLMTEHRLWGVQTGREWGHTGPASVSTSPGIGIEQYKHSVTATLLTGLAVPSWVTTPDPPSSRWIATPKSVHEHPLPDSVSGRGIAFLYIFPSPKNVTWRGVGGAYVPGPVTRPTFYMATFSPPWEPS